ncbi:patatin-like phospholipase family protein [Bacillus fonticola]|uniref:patatin-like phospholipase family protein n=1 Tax=Bacillus fonticola TaxID=2728853 RepID=UPI001474F8CF|nr:patatin-like phospholipase family protein [Bacillus fonticola]
MQEPKIALALGSGGARGFAHLGVLRVLTEEGIPIHFLAGSSMGALVACFYGAGHEIHRLYTLAKSFERRYYLDFTLPRMGLLSGERVKEFIRLFTHNKQLEELHIPVSVVAVDLRSGERVVLRTGSVADSVRASISIPGIFVPEEMDGRLLVDGGVLDRVPTEVARDMGADVVIAVDVASNEHKAEIHSIYDVIMRSIDLLQTEVVRVKKQHAEVWIEPKVNEYSARAFTNISEIITIGEEAARKALPTIRNAIGQWKEFHHE